MSRFADQLPVNIAPNGANFILATNDSDPKALERIPFASVGGGSKQYTILTELDLDIDSNVSLTAGLYLYVGNAPANLNLTGLVDGERVEIINHTAHKCYLFGFTNWLWNGTTTALLVDSGLILEQAGLIVAKHSGNLLLFNTLPNGLSQNIREGLVPPFLTFTYVSDDDTNDILYYLGTQLGTTVFANPHAGLYLNVTESGAFAGFNGSFATNRNLNDYFWSNSQVDPWFALNFFSGINIRPKTFLFANHVAGGKFMNPLKIEGYINGGWQTLAENINNVNTWFLVTLSTVDFYSAFRFTRVALDFCQMAEIRIYGDFMI